MYLGSKAEYSKSSDLKPLNEQLKDTRILLFNNKDWSFKLKVIKVILAFGNNQYLNYFNRCWVPHYRKYLREVQFPWALELHCGRDSDWLFSWLIDLFRKRDMMEDFLRQQCSQILLVKSQSHFGKWSFVACLSLIFWYVYYHGTQFKINNE